MADDDAVEAMYQMPGAEGDSARADYSAMPLASETPADVTSRQYQADTATRAYGRIKAADLNSRGIPSYVDTTGAAKPFVDDTGAPLTNSDPKNEIAYDSGGNAVKYSNRNPSLTPTVSDAYDGAPTQTDKQGNIYATPKGLPWVWQGQDPQIAAQVQQQQQDKLNQQTSNALAPYEQQAKISAVQAQKAVGQSAKATQAIMTQSGASLSDPDGDPIDLKSVDGPTLKGAIQDSFDKEYAAPAANEKPWFGGGQYSSAATAIRADIDNRKQRAMTAADTHIDALTNAQQAGDAYDQIQQQRIQLASAKLDSVNQSRLAQGMEPVSIPGLEMAGPTGNNGQAGGPSGSAGGNAPATSQGQEQTAIPGLETSQAEPPANPPISQEDHQKIAAALPAPAKQALAPVKTDADGKVQPEGFWATAGRAFGTRIIPSVATAAGGLVAGGLAIESGPGAIAADIAGGTAAGYGAAKAQRAIMGDQWANENDAQMAANAKAHPVAAQIGTIVPFLVSILGGGGGGIVKAGEEGALKLGTNTVTAAGKQAVEEAIATGTKAALPTAERVIQAAASGARGGGGEAAQDPNATPGSVADSMAKNALAFGATGLFAPAKTILQTVLNKPVSDALAMTLAGSMYDTAIHGQPFDIKKIAEQTGANIPAFVLQNALLGFLGHGMAAKSGESGGPEAKAGETPPEPQGGPTIPGIEPESTTKELSLDEIQKVFAKQLKNDPKPDAGNVIRHAPLEFTQLLNKKADSGAESAPMTAKGALEAVDTRLGAINELPDPGAASEEKTNLEDYRKVLVDALTGKEPSEEAPTSDPVRTEGARQPETQAKGVQVEYAPEPKAAEPAKESPINEVTEKTGERLFTQPNLNAKGEHVGTDEVTDVGKTEDDNGKPVYQVNYEKNGEKKVGYSDNPAWEAHEKYRDAETRKADAAAKKSGVEYQGKSMGLHAFKEPETGGNFSIPEGDVTPEKVQAGRDAVKKAFADNPIMGVGEHTEADIDRAIALAKTPVKQNEKENTAASKGAPQTGGNESTPTGGTGADAVRGGQASEITPEHAKSAVTRLRNGKLKPQFDLLQTRLEHLGPSASSAAQSGLRAQVNPNSQKIEILHDAAGTADSMKTVQDNWEQRGLSPEDGKKQATQWLNSAMNEELIHARQLVFERGGPQFDKTYVKIWREQIPEPIRQLVVALRNRKESDAERGAEYERMVIQQRETGTITEAHVGSPKYEQFYEALKPFLETPQSGPMEDNIARVMTLAAEHEEPEAKEEPSKEAEAKEALKKEGRGPPSFSTAAQIGEYTEGKRAKLKGALAREYGIDEKQATVIMNGLYNDDSSDSQYERAHKIIEALKLSPDRNAEIEHHPEIGENGSLMPISNRFKASDIASETDPVLIASSLINGVRLGGDKVQHTEQHLSTLAALLRAKETGMSWLDIAKYLDELTTRNAGTMSGKEFLFSEWGKKVKAFADEYGIELPAGDLEKKKASPKPQRQLAASKPQTIPGLEEYAETIKAINHRLYEPETSNREAGSKEALRNATAHLKSIHGSGDTFETGRKADAEGERRSLIDWAKSNGMLVKDADRRLPKDAGGFEHVVTFDPVSNRVIKRTTGGDFGLSPKVIEGKLKFTDGSPLEYLQRIAEANDFFGDDIRFHGVTSSGAIVTSQPAVSGVRVPLEKIREGMKLAGFEPLSYDPYSFYRPRDNAAVFDVSPSNVVMRDGEMFPFDSLFLRPQGELKEAIKASLAASKPERQPDTGKVGESESPVENLTREAEQAGVVLKTDELKGLIRQDPAVMAAIRAKIKTRTGEDALWAAKPLAVKLEELSEKVGLTSIIDDVQKLLSPDDRLSKEERMRFAETGDPNAIGDARKTGIILDEITAKMDRRKKQLEAALKETRELVSKLPEAQQLELMKRIDEGTPLKPGPFKDAFDAIGKMDADRTQESKDWFAAHGQEHWANYQNFIKNIVPHYFEDQTQATKIVDDYIRERKQMSGGTGFLKHREGVTMREIIDYAKSKGIDLKPKHTNVIDSIMDRWMQQERYFGAHEMIQRMVENGTGHWENSDYQPKANEKMVNNIIGNRTIEGPDGNRHKQFFYASEPSARIVNNYLSSGLRQTHKWIDNYFQAANVLNSAQLGLSAFHAFFTSTEALVSSFALGVEKLLHGNAAGFKDIALSPLAPILDWRLGTDIRKTMLDPKSGSQIHQAIVNEMVAGGFRDGVDSFYHDNHIQAFLDAYRQHKVFSSALRAPLAIIELLAKPIMEHLVPRFKAASVYKLAQMHIDRKKDIDPMEFRRRLQESVRAGNDRFGQYSYPALHLHKTVKDTLMMMTRSLGWNWGSIAALGGGLKEWAAFGKNAAKYGARKIGGGGKNPPGEGSGDEGEYAPGGAKFPRITSRMAYVLAMPLLIGLIGAVLSAMFGQTPDRLRDYFFVKTGETDDHGHAVRVAIPSYMRDLMSWSRHPLTTLTNKLHPLISMVASMLQNKDYFGVEIRHSGDPIMKQILQDLAYAGKQLTPFSFTNANKLSGSGVSTPLKIATSTGALLVAPSYAGKSPAEELADDINHDAIPQKVRTQEQADHSALVNQLTSLERAGKAQALMQKSLADGKITSKDVATIMKQSALTPLQASVNRLSLQDAEKVNAVASTAEQAQLRPLIAAKAVRAGKPMYRMSGY